MIDELIQQLNKFYEQGKYSEAIPLAEQILAIVREKLGDNHSNTCICLNNLAELYRTQGRYTEAESLYQQALAIIQKKLGDNHPNTADVLNNLAGLYHSQGKYTEAEPIFQKALAITREQLGDYHPNTAASLNNLAALYHDQGRYIEAEPLYQEALAIKRKQLGDNHPSTAISFNSLAELYKIQGRYIEAESLQEKSLAIKREQLGDNHPNTANSLNNLAVIYYIQGRYTEAELSFQEALAIRREQFGDNHPDTAQSLDNLALLYCAQGRYTEAEPLYQEALAIRREQLGDNHPSTAYSRRNLAGLYRVQGRYIEAEPLYQEALAIRRKQLGNNHPDTASSLDGLATLYHSQRRYTEAEPLYQEALAIKREQLGDNHPDIADSLNNLAGLYHCQGIYSKAEPLYQEALAIRREQLGDNHPDIAIPLNNLAALYHSQGNISQTIEFETKALEVEEYNLSENLIAGSEQQKRDYIATIFSSIYSVITLSLKTVTDNPDATKLALTAILQRKGRILDVLCNSFQILRQQTDDSTTQDLLTQIINLRSQYSNLVFSKPDDIEYSEIYSQQLNELDTKAKQLEDQLSRRSAEFRTFFQSAILENIQKLIPNDLTLIEIFRYQFSNPRSLPGESFAKPHYAAYILRRQGEIQAIDLGEAEVIDKEVQKFRKYLRNPRVSLKQLKSSARKLDKLVMQPVRQLLEDNHNILLSPDADLNLIPFEALVDENNQYLVENYNFTYLTSGRDLLRLKTNYPSEQPPLVIADPLYNQPGAIAATNRGIEDLSQLFSNMSFGRLAETANEAQALQKLFSLPEERIKTKKQATENALKRIKSPSFLHIATHGFFLAPKQSPSGEANVYDNPLLRSGLVFAGVESRQSGEEDGIMTAYETTLLNLLGTKLVVLSACDTGVGDSTSGEGIYGLRRALVIAGSESQVISLWKVSDTATKDLMVSYYQNLKAGQGRSEALHQIQRQMLRGELKGKDGKLYEHPYYWASFIPSGDWTPMEFNLSQ